MVQLKLPLVEKKEEVFYVRCRPKIKKLLEIRKTNDGFSSMSDWFEQWVLSLLGEKRGSTIGKKIRKARKSAKKRNRKTSRKRNGKKSR